MGAVTVVSTPDDGSCGIGTYTGELLDEFPSEVTVTWVTVPLRSPNPLPYLVASIRAGLTDDPTIHVQHEYGIYGPKSLWSWLFFPVLLVLANLRGRRVVVTFHSAWNDETIGPPLVRLKRLYVAANNRLLAATADHAVFLSDNAADAFQRSVSLRSVETIPHGVQVETRSLSKSEARRQLGYESEEPLVVLPGYIRPEKGCDAFVAVAERFDTPFVLAGGCQDAPDYCESLAASAPDNVAITGHLDEDAFHAAFVAADVVLLPYREVTQSGVFNWCVAYGVPVVGSDTPYFRSLADEWGCVEVVETSDPDAAADRIRSLLTDDERRDALRDGMADYRTAASMANVGRRHVEIYAPD
ncbi:MAG: glycosyltransferase [Halobaculum sp.]